jgi:hypothetical protein
MADKAQDIRTCVQALIKEVKKSPPIFPENFPFRKKYLGFSLIIFFTDFNFPRKQKSIFRTTRDFTPWKWPPGLDWKRK